MNYEQDLHIDENALDIEWLEQAELALKYGRHWAQLKRQVSDAEEQLKVIRAELITEANKDPVGCCNKEKPNAGDIEAYYRQHQDHIEAKKNLAELQYELDLAVIAKNEVSFTRKAALEYLVILHGQQYFAGPKVPRDLTAEKREREQRQRGVQRDVASKLQRTRK